MRSIGEVFIGYHTDASAAIIMQLFEDRKCKCDNIDNEVRDEVRF